MCSASHNKELSGLISYTDVTVRENSSLLFYVEVYVELGNPTFWRITNMAISRCAMSKLYSMIIHKAQKLMALIPQIMLAFPIKYLIILFYRGFEYCRQSRSKQLILLLRL